MPASVTFRDMSATVTPPNGHFEPVPVTLGPSWQPNDIRILFVSGSSANSSTTIAVPMTPDPPTGFTSGYAINPGVECQGAYWRRLVAGDNDTSVAFPKPSQWRHYMLALLTARGVSPTAAVTAGALVTSYTVGNAAVTISSVTVPAAGCMVFLMGTVPDPESTWPSWATSMQAPTGWTNLVATDKSGANFYQFDTNPGLLVVAKLYSSSGSTGTVSVPVGAGAPATAGMYIFLQPGADVSATIGAA